MRLSIPKVALATASILFAHFALLSNAAAVTPAPDGAYPGDNTAEGDSALSSLDTTQGIFNTAIGNSALEKDITGSYNTAVGTAALSSDTADNNTGVGFEALQNNTTGTDNTGVGVNTLFSNTNGNDNTALGFEVLLNNSSGTANTASGLHAMQFNTTGSDNTASGLIALQSNTSGAENTALGAFALAANSTGKNNTAEGSGALANATTGSNNVAVGFDAAFNLKSGSNNIEIGANVVGNSADANTIRIGKQGTQKATFVAGIFGTAATGSTVVVTSAGKLGVATSSARFKEAIKPMDKGSEAILALKPVSFRYKGQVDPDRAPQFGLVAEEVEKVDPQLVVHDEGGKPFTVRYDAVNAMLLNEFLKEHRKVEEQGMTIAQMKKQIESLTAMMQKVSEQIETNRAAAQLAD